MRGCGSHSSASLSIRFHVRILLTAPSKDAPPEMGNCQERPECTEVCRHCVVAEEAGDDLAQPYPLF